MRSFHPLTNAFTLVDRTLLINGFGPIAKRLPVRFSTLAGAALLAAAVGQCGNAEAQAIRRGGTAFAFEREVVAPPGKGSSVIVTEFLHHGQIAPDGRNVAVVTRQQQYVPSRILQLGPGDFCRLAIQALPGQTVYQVLYGGPPAPEESNPAWTSREGLLLETRRFTRCDLMSLESVQGAFKEARPIGADYVDGVMHSCNPFLLVPDAFMSRYSGTMHIAEAGTYGFFLSTEDCGFLLIDGKMVASAPGRHRALRQARPEARSLVALSKGAHAFELYHATTGPEAIMALAWEPKPGASGSKPKPERIPPEVWNPAAIAHVPAQPPTTRESKFVPDFFFRLEGDVPLPDNELPLVRVTFLDNSVQAVAAKSKLLWEFGDGQTSEEAQPTHVYLKSGLYTVRLTVTRQPKSFTITNRIYINRPINVERRPKLDELDDYLPILSKYDGARLDAPSMLQLVAAFAATADKLEAPPEETGDETANPRRRRMAKRQAEPADPAAEPELSDEEWAARRAEARDWIARAVAAGCQAFASDSPAQGDAALMALARQVGPMARNRLGDSPAAFKMWEGGTGKIQAPELRAECAVEAADIAVNDLLDRKGAKALLDGAKTLLGETKKGPAASSLLRVRGDYHAATGDGRAARQCYREAETLVLSGKSLLEQNAWRGARNRSAEDYLQEGDFGRAAEEIRAWEREFPTEKIDGQVVFMYARYWAGREKYDQAIAMSNQLLNVNRDSPYADQMLMLAAGCESKRGNAKAASATLHALVHDYPGSPLVPQAKEGIKRVEAGQALESPTRRKRKKSL